MTRPARACAFALLLALLSAVFPTRRADARDVGVNDPSTDNTTVGDAQDQPSIAAWGTYVLAIWNDSAIDAANQGVGFGYSTNSGQTWTDGGDLPDAFLPGGLWTGQPNVAVNERTGEFYVVATIDPDVASIEEHGIGIMRANFSGTNLIWTPLKIVKSLQDLGEGDFIDDPAIAVDSLSGNVYLTYTRFTASEDSIIFIRSTDRGASWGPQLVISPPVPAPYVQNSRVAVGPAGEVYVIWRQVTSIPSTGPDLIKIRKSTNFGVSFGPEQTVVSFYDNWGNGSPGYSPERNVTFPSIAVDHSNGAHRGRVYVGWHEGVDFYDATFGPGASRAEVEPNDTTATATTFTIGDTLVGGFGRPSEFDYYRFAAVQGQTYVFRCDVHALEYTMRVFCTDGVTRLALSGDRNHSPPQDGVIVWTCPNSGTYYFRMAEFEGGTGPYRVLTGVDPPGGPNQRGRDQRDLFVTTSDNGTAWSTPVRVNGEPPLFDDWQPQLAVDGNGSAYVLWYDWRDGVATSCAGQSLTYLARSDDGGSTWQQVGALSSQPTAWTTVRTNDIEEQSNASLFANALGVYACWTDGRAGTPDVWASRSLLTPFEVDFDSDSVSVVKVKLTWRAQGSYPATADVYRSIGTAAFSAVATNVAFDGSGRLTFHDTSVTPGQPHHYRVGVHVNGVTLFMGDRSVNVPARPTELGLLSVSPNPTPHNLRVDFALPNDAPAQLTLFDLTGRKLREITVQGVGRRQIDFWPEFQLDAGIYLLRLTQGGRDIVRRVSIVP